VAGRPHARAAALKQASCKPLVGFVLITSQGEACGCLRAPARPPTVCVTPWRARGGLLGAAGARHTWLVVIGLKSNRARQVLGRAGAQRLALGSINDRLSLHTGPPGRSSRTTHEGRALCACVFTT
jgi:hypothetical protein